ncbi:MAG: hypothetical protein R3F41_02140 [Gammaproteobacteria bacterium]|nr:hypothetical protein [Pseudomonadales bacterium]
MSKDGEPGRLFLYSDPSKREIFEPYETAVTSAGRIVISPFNTFFRSSRDNRGFKFKPASFEGRRREVWTNLSVVFTKRNESNTIKVYQSMLYHVDDYGWEYSDPQRVISEAFPNACRGIDIGAGVWIAVDIDHEGTPSNARVVSGDTREACEKRLIEIALESDYIPAKLEQSFVSATYVDAWFPSY